MEKNPIEACFDFSVEGVYIYRTSTGLSEITNLSWRISADRSDVALRFVRGDKMPTTAKLFDEFASALQFPYYFGENWDSFDECIADLEWLNSDICTIIVTKTYEMLANESMEQLDALFDCFKMAGTEFASRNKQFFVILQDTTDVVSDKPRYLSTGVVSLQEINIERFW